MVDLEKVSSGIKKFTVAIDFGSAFIKGVMGVVTENGSIELVAMEKEPSCGSISCGKVKNIEQASGLLKTMMKKLKNRISKNLRQQGEVPEDYKIEIEKVYVTVNVGNLQGVSKMIERNHDHEEITQELLDNMMCENVRLTQRKYPKNSSFSFYKSFPQCYIVDGVVEENPVGLICDHLMVEYQNILVPGDYFDNLEMCMQRAGFENGSYELIFGVEALANASLTPQEMKEGAVLVDFGEEVTSVSIWNNNTLKYVYELPKGSSRITADLEELKIPKEIATVLKHQGCAYEKYTKSQMVTYEIYGTNRSFDMRTINGIIECRVDKLMALIAKVKDSVHAGALVNSAIVVGGGCNLKGAKEKMEEYLGVGVRKGSVGTLSTNADVRSWASLLSVIYLGKGESLRLEKIPQKIEDVPVKNAPKRSKTSMFSLPKLKSMFDIVFTDPSGKESDKF